MCKYFYYCAVFQFFYCSIVVVVSRSNKNRGEKELLLTTTSQERPRNRVAEVTTNSLIGVIRGNWNHNTELTMQVNTTFTHHELLTFFLSSFLCVFRGFSVWWLTSLFWRRKETIKNSWIALFISSFLAEDFLYLFCFMFLVDRQTFTVQSISIYIFMSLLFRSYL